MNCDCIKRLEEKVADHYQTQIDVLVKAECSSATLFLTEEMGMDVGIKIDFTVTADKPGYRKGKKTFVRASYCPFCGTKAIGQEQGK